MTETIGSSTSATGSRPRRQVFARLRDRIVASDPAFSRLRLSSRAVISMIATSLILAGITMVQTLPFAAYGLAIIFSFLGSISVRDKSYREQAITRISAGVLGTIVVIVAGTLSKWPVIAAIAFLILIFIAVYVRRQGPRFFSIGIFCFMAYFMGDYLHPTPSQMGWIALAVAIAAAVTHFVAAVLLTDQPERDFRRAITTMEHRINIILVELKDAAQAGRFDADGQREFESQTARFRDTILMAEGFIPQGKGGALAGTGPASELALSLFDLQLAVERLVSASVRALPPLQLVEAALYLDETTIARTAKTLGEAGESNEVAVQQVLIRAHRARQRLEAKLREHPMAAFTHTVGQADTAQTSSPAEKPLAGFIPATFRIPIQVTLASAIAISAGEIISSTRWYWAVIASFIVFNNTRSRADTALRALSRSVGTFAGIIVGTVIATMVHGAVAVSLAGMTACFFLAFYFLQTSYGVMIFFLTIAIALLYGIMGLFTPELLVLRLEETITGALAGAFCAFFVFPVRASSGVATALDTYLDSLSALVAAADARVHGRDMQSDIVALSRAVDKNYGDLADLARPLGGPWNIVTRYGEVREKLLLLAGCAHWSRVLARSISKGIAPESIDVERFDRLTRQLERRIAHARQTKRRFFLKSNIEGALTPEAPRRSLAVQEDESPVLAIEVMSALLTRAMSGVWRGQS